MEIVKVDKRGRILIPKDIRVKTGVKEGGYVRLETDGERIIIEPLKPVSDRYFGMFKVERWPEDLDDFIVEAVKRWWRQNSM